MLTLQSMLDEPATGVEVQVWRPCAGSAAPPCGQGSGKGELRRTVQRVECDAEAAGLLDRHDDRLLVLLADEH